MLGGDTMMNYQPKFEELMNIAYAFREEFDYTIESHSMGIEGMGCAFINLEKNGFPKLKIYMDRFYLDFEIYFSQNCMSLVSIYKYLHPKEILRNSLAYRNKKTFRDFIIKDQCKYLKEILTHKDNFDYEDFRKFYEKYPLNVWKWIEK